MDKEPTEAQIKEFWEWCGFYLEKGENYMDGSPYQVWHYPHSLSDYGYAPNPPRIPIDLNNLFKYAKNVVQEKLGYKEFYKLLLMWCADVADGKDPALSLYWLFWEVING